MENAQHLVVGAGLFRTGEETVEESDIVVGQVEMARLFRDRHPLLL